jgi:LacI family transcriptional regulator
MIRGALDVAEASDHTVLIAETGSDRARVARALEVMLDHQPDGLIIALMGAKEIDVPADAGRLPVVLLNATSTTGHTCVLPGEFEAGRAVASHLAQRGHTRIALIGDHPELRTFPRISATIGHRFAGVEAGLGEYGLKLTHDVIERFWEPENGYDATNRLIEDGLDVTAVIAANDRVAFGVYQSAQEAGLRIPEDLSVISFDDEVIAGYLRPTLTTARIPYEEMGRRAMSLVLAPDRPHGEILVEMPIQVRGSVATRDAAC